MKNLLILVISLFIWVCPKLGHSQYSLDSLKSVWYNENNEDTIRFNAMFEILQHGQILSYQDSLIHYTELEITEAKALGLDKYLAHGLVYKCFINVGSSQIASALNYADSANTIYEELGDKYGIAWSNSYKGLIWIFTDKQDEGLELMERSFMEMKDINDTYGMLSCSQSLATGYNIKSDFTNRMYHANLSLQLSKELGNWVALASSYHGMADIYLSLEITDEGDLYHEKALEYCQKSGFKSEEMNILGHIAAIEHQRGNYEKSIQYIDEVLDWREKYGSDNVIYGSRAKKIYVLVEAEKYEEAKKLILSFNENYDSQVFMASFYKGMVDYSEGNMLTNLGKPDRGAELCLSALNGISGFGQLSHELHACECLYEAHKIMGNHERALEYHEKRQEIQEAIHKDESLKELQRMEFHKQQVADSLATVESERLVEIAHQDEMQLQKRNKNIFLFSGLALLVLAGGLYSRVYYIRKSKATLQKEKDRSENLLLNILPEEIAQELKEKGKADARDFEMVSILFTDFKGFTEQSAKLSAAELVHEINHCFEAFDGIIEKYKVEKIKTIGDAYMAAGGLPVPTDDSVKNTVLAALEMQEFIINRKTQKDAKGEHAFEMRVGIHTGPVVAGIVGVKKFQYDIWGDTVNTASRMESNSEAGKVNISQATYELLKDETDLKFESRGKIDVKGKGLIDMWYVEMRDEG